MAKTEIEFMERFDQFCEALSSGGSLLVSLNDEGVPVERISHTLVDVDVAAAARTVYDSLKPIRREVTTPSGLSWPRILRRRKTALPTRSISEKGSSSTTAAILQRRRSSFPLKEP